MDNIANPLKNDKELVFPHIFQLSASAGSGKTHNLSLRYVQFLLSSKIKSNNTNTNNLNNIIAITFTNKAAGEMKDRILNLLKSIAIGDKDAIEQVKKVIDINYEITGTGSSANTKNIQEKALFIADNIIKNYSDFNVKTIDSFLTDIIKASLLETDIKPGFNIIMNPTSYIEYALDSLLLDASDASVPSSASDSAEWSNGSDGPDGNKGREIKNMFKEFIKNYTVIEGKSSFNPRKAIVETIKELRNIENTEGKYFSVPNDEDYLIKSHDYIEKNINGIYERPFETDDVHDCGGKLQELVNSIEAFNNINISDNFEVRTAGKAKTVSQSQSKSQAKSKAKGIALNKNVLKGLAKISKMDFSSAYLLKKDIRQLITNAKSLEGLDNLTNLDNLNNINKPDRLNNNNKFDKFNNLNNASDFNNEDNHKETAVNEAALILIRLQQTWDSIRESIKNIILTVNGIKFYSYIKILKEVKKIIAEKSKNDGNIFIDELKIKINELIRNNRVPEIYFNIGEKIYHYLIDEFQDTDRLQWENIKALVGNSIANGGTFFYVGDKKQSIYRFKGGDADLFDEVMDDFRSENIIYENNFYEEKLSYNFRSKKELISFFNQTFSPENLVSRLLSNSVHFKDSVCSDSQLSAGSIDSLVNKNIAQLINTVYKDHEQESPDKLFKKESGGGRIYIERILEKQNGYDQTAHEQTAYEQTANERTGYNKNSEKEYISDDTGNDGSNGSDSTFGNADIFSDDALNSQKIKEICLEKTINIIEDIKTRNYKYKDIAILTRTNQESSNIVLRLKRDGIPAESEQNADIRNNALIKEVISFMKFINKPSDNLSLINFISGSIFDSMFSASDFFAAFKNELNYFVAQNRDKKFIYPYFKKWFQENIARDYYFEPLINSAGYYPPYDFVCMFYQKFNIYENFKNNLGFFMHLLELLKNREQESENSLGEFIDFFENVKSEEKLFLVKLNSDKDAVNVLTMHKSKGLQFPIVIIPYAGLKVDSPNKIIVDYLSSNNIGGNENGDYTGCGIALDYADKTGQNFLLSIVKDIIENIENSDALNLNDELNADAYSDFAERSEIKYETITSETSMYETSISETSMYETITEEDKAAVKSVVSYIRQKSLNFIDELNLFYVTLTRAENELYILLPPKIGIHKNRLINLFFNGCIVVNSADDNIISIN
jgi:ATP-dependent exoDNAse (exonuclease V) beta subunit